jgi:secondary thiamine-phosphate synthase enzyme
MFELRIRTSRRIESRNITEEVLGFVRGKKGKILHVYTPHTTCGIVINEDADPHVMEDVLEALDRVVPKDYPYKHGEGNSDAHIKSILTGCSVTIPFSHGMPVLGTWQGIFLMEFDGPRERTVYVTLGE